MRRAGAAWPRRVRNEEVAVIHERVQGHAVIWSGFTFAPFAYLLLSLFLLEPQGALPGGSLLPVTFAGIGLLQIAAAQVLWVLMKRGALPAQGTRDGRAPHWAVVVWALDEAPAILGLVLILLGGPRAPAFGLMAASVGGLMLNPYWTLEGGA